MIKVQPNLQLDPICFKFSVFNIGAKVDQDNVIPTIYQINHWFKFNDAFYKLELVFTYNRQPLIKSCVLSDEQIEKTEVEEIENATPESLNLQKDFAMMISTCKITQVNADGSFFWGYV